VVRARACPTVFGSVLTSVPGIGSLFGLQRHRLLPGIVAIILVAECDLALSDVQEPIIGNGHAGGYNGRRSPIPARDRRKAAWRKPPIRPRGWEPSDLRMYADPGTIAVRRKTAVAGDHTMQVGMMKLGTQMFGISGDELQASHHPGDLLRCRVAHLRGCPPESRRICRSFPDLSRAQVYECLAYYEDHRTEIDALVVEQMSEEIR
jgi:hypothetical protein